MRILLLNQAFPPDVVSTAQHAGDLTKALAAAGHQVTVIASVRGYDDPTQRFPRRSSECGATVIRILTTAFGKSRAWRRAVDFASFFVSCSLRLAIQPRYDVVIAMTSPPLISFLAGLFARLRGVALVLWVMDLNPDEAIAAGWLDPKSAPARLLEGALRFSLHAASRIVALDSFMRERILKRGVDPGRISVIAPWSHDNAVAYDPSGRDRFRSEHRLTEKFVVMYSGNLSPCHPLDTLLAAARLLTEEPDIVFCFIGGGSGMKQVSNFAAEHMLTNIVRLPYQPMERLSDSLSAADLHVVAMGVPFVGIVHPCKIYNILALGTPFLYIGPETSHITELIPERLLGQRARCVVHGNVEAAVRHITEARLAKYEPEPSLRAVAKAFSQSTLIPKFIAAIKDSSAENSPAASKRATA